MVSLREDHFSIVNLVLPVDGTVADTGTESANTQEYYCSRVLGWQWQMYGCNSMFTVKTT